MFQSLAGIGVIWSCIAGVAAQTAELGMQRPMRIGAVTPDKTSAAIYDRVTLVVDLEAAYDNPFDSRQIAVDAIVTPDAGEAWSVPGFLYRPCQRRLEGGDEHVEPAGDPAWHVRLSFPKPGSYSVLVRATDRTGATAESQPVTIEALATDAAGMARRHPEDSRYFVTDRGESLYLIGANVCWGNAPGTFSYDDWLPQYAANGCNFFRVWLSPAWTTFGLNSVETGYNGIDLENAWRLDYVLESAERLGLRAMLCIDSFNILSPKDRLYGRWEDTPYIAANGGPLEYHADYFTNEEMCRAYRDRLRYLVARYGYSPHVFAWEFWNEVDIVGEYRSAEVAAWHRDMATYLRGIDPWKHLITTSFASPLGDPAVDTLPELDFVQTHHYGAQDMARDLLKDRATKEAAKDRPHFHGEYGIGHQCSERTIDPQGIYVHNGAFASVGQLHAGVPMSWWWDCYIPQCNIYPIFGAFARWIAGFDFVAEQVRPAAASVVLPPEAVSLRTPEDSTLHTGNASWSAAPFNQPLTFTLSAEGVLENRELLPRALHGVRNHPDLHNPLTFDVTAPYDTTFGVIVEGVSGHGGAALRMSLDGKVLVDEVFEDKKAADTETMNEFDRTYSMKVPAGQHTILIENLGTDWFYAAYEIPWLASEPPARVLGVTGNTQALIWVQSRFYTWRNATRKDFAPAAISNAVLRVKDLSPGTWTVEFWDARQGEIANSVTISVGADGEADVPLPPFTWDTALRFRRQPSNP